MLGIGIAAGEGVGVGLLVAIFVSNLPEAIGASADLQESGTSKASIRKLWVAVAAVCVLATMGGYAIADSTSGDLQAAINGFAAGALLVMLIDSMIPAAGREGRPDRRPRHRPRLRRRGRAVGHLVTGRGGARGQSPSPSYPSSNPRQNSLAIEFLPLRNESACDRRCWAPFRIAVCRLVEVACRPP